MQRSRPGIVGHRGAADVAPENTLKAFRRGITDGADLLECDVHRSADGRDVIIHDATIDRTAQANSPLRTGAVAELTRAELDQVLVGDDEHIPTLSEVLDVAVRPDGSRVPVLVEIKAPAVAELAVRILLERFGDEEALWGVARPPARVISFHAEALRTARDIAPAISRGFLTRELTEQSLQDAREVRATTLSVRLSELRDGDLDRIRAVGIQPGLWAIRTDAEIRRAVDLGAPWIGADDPARTRAVIEAHLS